MATRHNSKSFAVKNHGLCVRAAALLVKAAKVFDAEIIVKCNHNSANATNIFNVLSLCAVKGMEITVIADGREADKAISAIRNIFTGSLLEDTRTMCGSQ
ncbi:MAG: HPr family phosphocarrier protein [Kiritimatiellae bacterium]|nr:HPr family phosphocarrier protein [Kiritimatiellia bacterium]MDD5521052.1 HPr family phosphocarrier protein [Kiritimatiellia bacterium]